MAILKIKQLEERLAAGTQDVVADSATYATSAGQAGTSVLSATATLATSAGKAGSSAYAGTSQVAAKGTSGSAL